MNSFDQLEKKITTDSLGKIPSVEIWNPPFSGDIDICIKANGDWYHKGIKFTRQPLVKLFSSILKKEGDDYFLVNPVEKWRVNVEDKPLLVIDCNVENSDTDKKLQKIRFTTSVDDIFYLDAAHPVRQEAMNSSGESKPYVLVRNNLEALIHRNVFYRLAELTVENSGEVGLWSCGIFFKLH